MSRRVTAAIRTVSYTHLDVYKRQSVAHVDSPRLDLKPHPLYENNDMAFFKTHYYGGIKKYQWTAIPLAMHGVLVKKDGTSVQVVVGEEEGDPQLDVYKRQALWCALFFAVYLFPLIIRLWR